MVVDERNRKLVGNRGEIELSKLEWSLLKMLIDSYEPLSVIAISENLYDSTMNGKREDAARSLIARFKLKLEDIGEGERLESIYGHGYIFQLD